MAGVTVDRDPAPTRLPVWWRVERGGLRTRMILGPWGQVAKEGFLGELYGEAETCQLGGRGAGGGQRWQVSQA